MCLPASETATCLPAQLTNHRMMPTPALPSTCATQAMLESPCFGVPGLCRYTAARSAWLREQIQAAIDIDGCRQVR